MAYEEQPIAKIRLIFMSSRLQKINAVFASKTTGN
jgi:hypothetical protein